MPRSNQNQGPKGLNLKMNRILLCKFNRLKNIKENSKLKKIRKKLIIDKNLISKSKRERFTKRSSRSKMIRTKLLIIRPSKT